MIQLLANSPGLDLRESVFTATNATPGTGIANLAAGKDAVLATAGMINIYNSASATGGDNHWIVPLYIRLTTKAVNTSATNFRMVGVLDNIDRYSSGGTTLVAKSTSYDTATGYTDRTSKATINVGVLTLAAANSAKTIFNTTVSEAILAADETLEIWFGAGPMASSANNVKTVPPIWIGRGCSLCIHELAASQTDDPEFEYEICWVEKFHPKF